MAQASRATEYFVEPVRVKAGESIGLAPDDRVVWCEYEDDKHINLIVLRVAPWDWGDR